MRTYRKAKQNQTAFIKKTIVSWEFFSNVFFPCRVKAKVVELYGLKSLEFEAVFGGPEPQFGESQRKQAAAPLNRAKKGQSTLDSWIKVPVP
jgi:hypothetical protein